LHTLILNQVNRLFEHHVILKSFTFFWLAREGLSLALNYKGVLLLLKLLLLLQLLLLLKRMLLEAVGRRMYVVVHPVRVTLRRVIAPLAGGLGRGRHEIDTLTPRLWRGGHVGVVVPHLHTQLLLLRKLKGLVALVCGAAHGLQVRGGRGQQHRPRLDRRGRLLLLQLVHLLLGRRAAVDKAAGRRRQRVAGLDRLGRGHDGVVGRGEMLLL